MGNMCGSSASSVPDFLKNQAFNLVVSKALGGSGDSQTNFLTSSLKGLFPNASVIANNVPSADPNLFNVALGNNLLFSGQQSGPIQNNWTSFVGNLTTALSKQFAPGGAAPVMQPGQYVAPAPGAFNTAATGIANTYGQAQGAVQGAYGQTAGAVQGAYNQAATGVANTYNQAATGVANTYGQAVQGVQGAIGQTTGAFGQATQGVQGAYNQAVGAYGQAQGAYGQAAGAYNQAVSAFGAAPK